MISNPHKVVYKNLQEIVKSTPQNIKNKENKCRSPNQSSIIKNRTDSNSQVLQTKQPIHMKISSASKHQQILHVLNSNVPHKFELNNDDESLDIKRMVKECKPQSNLNDQIETYQSYRKSVQYKSNQKLRSELSGSLSKHSLKSTPKIIQINRTSTQMGEIIKTQESQDCKKVSSFFNDRKAASSVKSNRVHTNLENYCFSNDKSNQKNGKPMNINNFNEYFNQVDALYTDLQDFLYMSKEKVMAKIRNQVSRSSNKDSVSKHFTHNGIQTFIQQLTNLTNAVKHNYAQVTNKPSQHSEAGKLETKKKFKTQGLVQQNSNHIRFIKKKQSSNNNIDFTIEQEESIKNLSVRNMKVRNSRKKEQLKDSNKKPSIYQMVLQQNHKKYISKQKI